MAEAAWVPLALGATSTAAGLGSTYMMYEASGKQKEAADRARQGAAINARNIAEETQRQVQLAREALENRKKVTAVRMAASGVRGTSFSSFLDELTRVGEEEIEWMKKSGSSRASAALYSGDQAASALEASSVSSMAGAFGQLPGMGESGYNWFNEYSARRP